MCLIYITVLIGSVVCCEEYRRYDECIAGPQKNGGGGGSNDFGISVLP
jgi:hypothetical protein